jgi:hypothetical protein
MVRSTRPAVLHARRRVLRPAQVLVHEAEAEGSSDFFD